MKLALENKSKLYIALITTLISLIILVTGTYAWFTLSLSGKVNEMELKVTAGDSLYVDTVSHSTITAFEGKNTVDNDAINTQMKAAFSGATLGAIVIDPVTTGNGRAFYDHSDRVVSPSALKYMEFTLYFMGSRDMNVYLTDAESSTGAKDGTKITSASVNNTSQSAIADCVRISFTDVAEGTTKMYEPNRENVTTLTVPKAKADNGNNATLTTTFKKIDENTDTNRLFHLTGEQCKEIKVRIWLEGEDPQCTDAVKAAKFLTQLRFEGVVE